MPGVSWTGGAGMSAKKRSDFEGVLHPHSILAGVLLEMH
jgi:hypothetical protein